MEGNYVATERVSELAGEKSGDRVWESGHRGAMAS